MRNFNLGSLTSWVELGMGQLIDFGIPVAGFRRVEFDIMADRYVSIIAVAGDDAWLVACGDGLMTCKFTADRPVAISATGDPDTSVFIRTLHATQTIPESLDPTYTTVEPARTGPTPELQRMMYLMRLNQLERDRQLAEERERLQQQIVDLQAAVGAPPPVPPVVQDESEEVIE